MAEDPKAERPLFQRVLQHWPWIVVALAVLFVLVVRVRLREMPLERDEGEYAYAGQLMLHGVPPYKEVYNMKLPGTYAAYALIMAVLGQSPSAIHIGVAFVNAASIILLFLIGRRILDDVTGVVAAVSFALLSLSPSVLGLAGHATHFITVMALGGALVLLEACQGRKPALFLGSGLLFGLAFLMKQHGLFFGIFGLMCLLWIRFEYWLAAREKGRQGNRPIPVRASNPADRPTVPPRRLNVIQMKKLGLLTASQGLDSAVKPQPAGCGEKTASISAAPPTEPQSPLTPPLRPLAAMVPLTQRTPAADKPLRVQPFPSPPITYREMIFFVGGLVLPLVITCLLLWWADVFPRFIFWTVTYAGQYGSTIPLAYGADMLRTGLGVVIGPNLPLWILPWAGAFFMWWDPRLTLRNRFFLVAFFLCAFASVSVGFWFRSHYFITLLPALALLSGIAVSRSVHLLKHDKSIELFLALPVFLLVLIGIGSAVIGNGAMWFGMSPVRASRSTYSSDIFCATAKAADFIKAKCPTNARVAVLGSEPEIYFNSGRHSATGYIYTYPLMETHAFALRMQQEMIAEIARARPEYVVFVDENLSWLPTEHSERKVYNWWKNYWVTNLDMVMTFRIERETEDSIARDKTVAGAISAASPGTVLVLKPKANK